MKASIYDEIKTLTDVESEFFGWLIPRGTIGTVVECYLQPKEGYAVDVAIPDKDRDGEFLYDNVILFPDQFEVMTTAVSRNAQERSPSSVW